jgi:hypothetical protein
MKEKICEHYEVRCLYLCLGGECKYQGYCDYQLPRDSTMNYEFRYVQREQKMKPKPKKEKDPYLNEGDNNVGWETNPN